MMLKVRLALMNFLQFAIWGAYLISMGTYLSTIELGSKIGVFYSMQGIVSIFMPAIMGIVADRWVPAQKLMGFCHLIAATFMLATGYCGMVLSNSGGIEVASSLMEAKLLFPFYSLSVAFYMPTLALSNSVAYTALSNANMDTVKSFPPIRVFGTIGFIFTMWVVDLFGFQANHNQFFVSAFCGLLLFVYSFSLPKCNISKATHNQSFVEALGFKSFALFKDKRMAIFFIFSMLLGVSLQITNSFANPFITSFKNIAEYADSFGVNHANILISLSQISETCCILLIPFFMKRYGIKTIMTMAMIAWVLRFNLLGLGNPGDRVWIFSASMIIYGLAFDLFNISGSLFVDNSVDYEMRSSAQGLFMLMTNGIGATVGTLAAQAVVNSHTIDGVTDWVSCWMIFACYAAVVAIGFVLMFRSRTEKL